jgi:lipopolysaccharide/colanic/teichoic acid biosynthesis glycosyltransferase
MASYFKKASSQDTATRMGHSTLKITTMQEKRPLPEKGQLAVPRFKDVAPRQEGILNEEAFHTMLTFERRRAERSRKPFALMLLDSRAVHRNGNGPAFSAGLANVISEATRETDITGWYENGTILAVIFTEINLDGKNPIADVLRSKVVAALQDSLDHNLASQLVVTFHFFPQSWDKDRPDRVADVKLYPEISQGDSKKRLPMVVKRVMDVVGASLLLLLCSPILAAISVAIKLTSKGPVVFEQDRLGQFGKKFRCLKFRTMYADNDPKIHREFVQQFIAGKEEKSDQKVADAPIYKITDDPRVTPVGRFLRKTSLDEFPQFLNVLRGDMSLVGPRPPVPYEFEVYDFWHRRRVLEVRPGVTGLWQVSGRSRTCFDDMVRLDLRYTTSWSLWLDLKILLATPFAMFSGDGAF